MEKKSQVIHLYEFDQQTVNHGELTQRILEALKPYLGQKKPDIKIRGRPHKYWAYFEAQPQICEKLNQLKKLRIGGQELNIGTYYHDYQIFIKSILSKISQKLIEDYFSQFGEIEHIVMTEPFLKGSTSYRRCYIKMKDDKVVDSIVMGQTHSIDGQEVKCVRTFGLDEDKESDKKLFLMIQGDISSVDQLEQRAIEFFMKYGRIRERPRIEPTNNQKNKMTITYASYKDANTALEAFNGSQWVKDCREKGLDMKLNFFYTKENKVYAVGLKDVNEKIVEEAFSIFGEVSEVRVGKLKNGTVTAIVGFVHEQSFKMALAAFMEEQSLRKIFATNRPNLTIYMTPEERKSFTEMKKKQARANMKPNSLPYGVNPPPQPFQYPGSMNPQLLPNQYSPNMPPQNYGPPQGFKSGFAQGPPPPMNMMGQGMAAKMPPPQVFPKNQ